MQYVLFALFYWEARRLKYKDVGVDIDRSSILEKKLRKTFGNVIGSFGGTFEFNGSTLVSSTDGIGSKLNLEVKYMKMNAAAQDLVAMNVNDISCMGAKPLFFLDYVGCHKINNLVLEPFFKSLKITLDSLDCKLLGGETAEMPFIYPEGMLDLAGFVVGELKTSDRKPLGPEKVKVGDVAIALPSSGPHSNGYTLVNKLLNDGLLDDSDTPLMNALLAPTILYVFDPTDGIHACAHITGGGLIENLPRIIPEGTKLDFEIGNVPEVFRKIQKAGNIPDDEMLRTFNMGTGFVLIVDPKKVNNIANELRDFNPRVAGKVCEDETDRRLRIR